VQAFLNAFPRSAEYVSLYIDGQLRKGLTSASDQQADDLLDKVLQIFRCVAAACAQRPCFMTCHLCFRRVCVFCSPQQGTHRGCMSHLHLGVSTHNSGFARLQLSLVC
jgi:cullin 3